ILTWLGALDEKAKITDLGRLMSVFPIAPRFSKMLIVGQQHGCLPYIIAIVATLTVGDPFVREYHQQSFTEDDYEDDEAKSLEAENLTNERIIEKEKRKALRARFLKSQAMLMGTDPSSDCLRLLSAVGAYEFGGGSNEFCQQHFLRPKAMVETRKLRSQLTHLVQVNCPGVDISLDPQMQPPTSKQRLVLRQAILAGFLDQVAIRVDIAGPSCGISAAAFEELAQHHKSGGDRKRQPAAYVTMWSGEPVFISPESVVHPAQSSRIKVGGERGGMVWPDLVVYTELQQTSRLYMKGVTQISPKWLVSIARDMCEFGKPRVSPLPKYNKERTQMECWVDVTFGPKRWTLPP
ncbi:putative ATP-dependent RNA helicase DHR1, partial [Spiromyces aspiralis]